MNKYLIRIANAQITVEALNDYIAVLDTGLFEDAHIVDVYKQTGHCEANALAWLYQVKVNGKIQLCLVERLFS